MQWAVAIPVRWAHNKTFPSQSAMQRHGHLQAQLLRASFKLFECVSCLGLQDVKILYVHVSWRNIGIVLSCFVPDLYIDIPLGAYALCIMVCSEPGEIGGFPRAARGPSTKMKTRGFDDIRRVLSTPRISTESRLRDSSNTADTKSKKATIEFLANTLRASQKSCTDAWHG